MRKSLIVTAASAALLAGCNTVRGAAADMEAVADAFDPGTHYTVCGTYGMFDRNGDGRISRDEWLAFGPAEFASWDANRNGRKVDLFYRQADQSQRWHSVEMQAKDNEFRGAVPGDYTKSPYPIQYYFEVHESGGSTIFPGFDADLSNQPYILVRRTHS